SSEWRDFGEGAVVIIPIEIIRAQIADKKIEPAVVVEIAPTRTVAANACGHGAREPFESAVTFVAIEKVFRGAIADEQVRKTIVIEITPRASRRIAAVGGDETRRDLRERGINREHRYNAGRRVGVVRNDHRITSSLLYD